MTWIQSWTSNSSGLKIQTPSLSFLTAFRYHQHSVQYIHRKHERIPNTMAWLIDSCPFNEAFYKEGLYSNGRRKEISGTGTKSNGSCFILQPFNHAPQWCNCTCYSSFQLPSICMMVGNHGFNDTGKADEFNSCFSIFPCSKNTQRNVHSWTNLQVI